MTWWERTMSNSSVRFASCSSCRKPSGEICGYFPIFNSPNGAIRHDLGSGCVTATPTSPDHGSPWPGHQVVQGDSYWNAGDNTPEWILDLLPRLSLDRRPGKTENALAERPKGCAYMLAGDKDDNGLFDDGKHYDCFARVPENMCVNDLQRAAFQAAAKIAEIMGDTAIARPLCRAIPADGQRPGKTVEPQGILLGRPVAAQSPDVKQPVWRT